MSTRNICMNILVYFSRVLFFGRNIRKRIILNIFHISLFTIYDIMKNIVLHINFVELNFLYFKFLLLPL